MTTKLRVGMVAPYEVVINLTPEEGVDLTDVSAATIFVRRPDGEDAEWTATLSNQTLDTLRLTHVLEDGDLPIVGTYCFYPEVTIPGGTLRTNETFEAPVASRFAK